MRKDLLQNNHMRYFVSIKNFNVKNIVVKSLLFVLLIDIFYYSMNCTKTIFLTPLPGTSLLPQQEAIRF